MDPTESFQSPTDPEGSSAPAQRLRSITGASSRLLMGAVIAIAALLLYVGLADEVMRSATQRLDAGVVVYLHNNSSPLLYRLMAGVSWAASGRSQSVLILAAAIYYVW